MSNRKRKRRPPPRPAEVESADTAAVEEEPQRPRPGLFRSVSAGPSPMPRVVRSFGRGFLGVMSQPVLVVAILVLVAAWWFSIVALGYEGTPRALVTVLAIPPISIASDLTVGGAMYGLGPSFLIFIGATLVMRTLILAGLVGVTLDIFETGRVTKASVYRAAGALPATFVFNVASFSALIAGNIVAQLVGAGIGTFAFFGAFIVPIYFLGFAPIAAAREGRPVLEELRRSARAAMLPNGRHLIFCMLYFLAAYPILLPLAPDASAFTSVPSAQTWAFAFVANVGHVAVLAALVYRWLWVEPSVPDEPLRRRPPTKTPAKAPSAKARSRR